MRQMLFALMVLASVAASAATASAQGGTYCSSCAPVVRAPAMGPYKCYYYYYYYYKGPSKTEAMRGFDEYSRYFRTTENNYSGYYYYRIRSTQ